LIEELYGPANDIYAIGKAGALPGDVIKKINDEKISTLDQLITILRNKRAGDEITVEILRNQNIITLDFTLDLRPSDV
jgi:S1-C subfamily serine protease